MTTSPKPIQVCPRYDRSLHVNKRSTRQDPHRRIQDLKSLCQKQERVLIFLNILPVLPRSFEPLVHMGQSMEEKNLPPPNQCAFSICWAFGLLLEPHTVSVDQERISYAFFHLLDKFLAFASVNQSSRMEKFEFLWSPQFPHWFSDQINLSSSFAKDFVQIFC